MNFDKSLDYFINEHNQEAEKCVDCQEQFPLNNMWICSSCNYHICKECKKEHGHMFYAPRFRRASN